MKRIPNEGWAEGGLLIHKAGASGWWHVTHQASYSLVDTGIDTRQQAAAIVAALLETGLDFTREVSYLKLHEAEIVAVLHRMHGELRLPLMDYGEIKHYGGENG